MYDGLASSRREIRTADQKIVIKEQQFSIQSYHTFYKILHEMWISLHQTLLRKSFDMKDATHQPIIRLQLVTPHC